MLGERRYEKAAQQNQGFIPTAPIDNTPKAPIDLSAFDAVLSDLGPVTRVPETSIAIVTAPNRMPQLEKTSAKAETIWTLLALMDDYFKRDGKGTGSGNVERAIKMFEDLSPQVKNLPTADIPLDIWDELYEFVQLIPMQRGRAVVGQLCLLATC